MKKKINECKTRSMDETATSNKMQYKECPIPIPSPRKSINSELFVYSRMNQHEKLSALDLYGKSENDDNKIENRKRSQEDDMVHENHDAQNRKIDGGSYDGGSSKGKKTMKVSHTHPRGSCTQPSIPLPEKKQLINIIERLQVKDTYGVFSEPVDPNELPDYFKVIKHPMDLGTVKTKVDGGHYKYLEEFEADVFLVCSNALTYNDPDSVYYRQAWAMENIARKDFEKLKGELDQHNEPTPKAVRRGRPPGYKNPKKTNISPNGQGFKTAGSSINWNEEFPAHIIKADMKSGNKMFTVDMSRRDTYKPMSSYEDDAPTEEMRRLVPVVPIDPRSYAQSITKFAEGLGPVAWKVASQKIDAVLPPGTPYGPGWVGELNGDSQVPSQTLSLVPEKQKAPASTIFNGHDHYNASEHIVLPSGAECGAGWSSIEPSNVQVPPQTITLVPEKPKSPVNTIFDSGDYYSASGHMRNTANQGSAYHGLSLEMIEAVHKLNSQNDVPLLQGNVAASSPWTMPVSVQQQNPFSQMMQRSNYSTGHNLNFGVSLPTDQTMGYNSNYFNYVPAVSSTIPTHPFNYLPAMSSAIPTHQTMELNSNYINYAPTMNSSIPTYPAVEMNSNYISYAPVATSSMILEQPNVQKNWGNNNEYTNLLFAGNSYAWDFGQSLTGSAVQMPEQNIVTYAPVDPMRRMFEADSNTNVPSSSIVQVDLTQEEEPDLALQL